MRVGGQATAGAGMGIGAVFVAAGRADDDRHRRQIGRRNARSPFGETSSALKRGSLSGTPAGRSDYYLDGRSPGSRVLALAAFPDMSSGFRRGLVAYSCGDSRGIGPVARTAFPLSPLRCGKGTVSAGFRLACRYKSTFGCDFANSASAGPRSPLGTISSRSSPSHDCMSLNSSSSSAAVSGGAPGWA